MLKLLALLFLLGACAPAFEHEQVWLPQSAPLYAAQQSWSMPLWFEPSLDETLTAAELPAQCGQPWKETLDGCALVVSGRLWVASDLTEQRREVSRAHELGHLLSFWLAGAERSQQHLLDGCDEPDAALMCPEGSGRAEPSPADFDFVLGM